MATYLAILLIFLMPISAESTQKDLNTKETYEDKVIRLGHPSQSKSVDPSQVVQLSWQPRSGNPKNQWPMYMNMHYLSGETIYHEHKYQGKMQVFLYRGFLSEEECNYLISRAHGKRSYIIQEDGSAKMDKKNLRNKFDLSLDTNDEIARHIEERISAWTFLPEENSKSLRVLHFGPESPKQNYNFIGNESTEQVGEPLLATVIIYLSNVSQGGQILFPQSEKSMWSDCAKSINILRPSRGNAILFFNQHLNATPDGSSSHARCPVLQGDMWCAIKFFHLKGVKLEVDPSSQSDGSDCTDEDENCTRWAAIGECQRNSVFMIGSPDYYGTCRKSCNAC
ncbi:hypothetical protein BUALT_Bualt01G0072100 [Buddleja alternifolia]|uniref:procollagen-proline 4-dioxygenase n=1 Tax=Buddleja alternifolia TaxID=168488 RepID=A0AAV6YB54_9LAMI|nr:hypothetical protein BUALT_Bualt01G0072100 [Buddleja alternifolia]